MAVIGEMLQLKIGNNTYSLPSGDHKWNDVELTKSAVAESSRSTVYATILTGTSVTTGYLMGATYSPSAGYIARYDANKYLYSDTPTTGDSSTKVATTAFVANAMSGVGAGTVTSVAVSNATNGGLSVSGSPITSSGTITIGHSNVLTSAQTTQAVYPIKIDKNGHISAYGSAVTIPTTAADVGAVPTTRTVNGKALSSDITLSASDVSALPSSTTIPTKTSDLTNDSGFVTTDEKLKTTALLSGTKYLIMGSTSGTAETKLHSTHLSFTSTRTFSIGSSGNKGTLRLYSSTSSSYTDLSNSATAARTITIPDATGTLALTSDIPTVPTNVSAFTNDAGYLTSYIETDPTVPSWAKASSKPSYNFSEIGSKPTTLFGYGITDVYTKTQVDGLVSGVLHYKGTKATVSALPTSGNTTGDVWHVTADGSEWAWDGSAWQELGTAIDLSGYAQLSGASFTGPVTFGDSVMADELETGDLVVTGAASFTNNIAANTINGVAVSSNPKFTDTVTTVTTTGSGNAITAISATNGAITATKGITVPTKVSDLTNDSGFITADEKVKLISNTEGYEYPIIFGPTNDITSGNTYFGNYSADITINPNNKRLTLKAVKFIFNSNSAATLKSNGYNGDASYNTPRLKFESLKLNSSGGNSYVILEGVETGSRTHSVATKGYVDSSIPTVPTITLNGSTTTSPSFYAPTTAGTNGYVLKSNGSGAPSWASVVAAQIVRW